MFYSLKIFDETNGRWKTIAGVIVLMAKGNVVHYGLRPINFFQVDESARANFGEVVVFSIVIWYELDKKLLLISAATFCARRPVI
mgnify:CR=1 FL=1